LGVLQRAVANEMSGGGKRAKMSDDSSTTMPSIAHILVDIFRAAIEKAYPGKDSQKN
jgi:hypothetical protein